MIEWIKTIFKDRPDTSTPITASWLNKLQDYMMQLGLIKDYVVDHDSNEKGNWEKWASGKLVQWGRKTIEATTSTSQWGSTGLYNAKASGITYPIPFVGINPNTTFGYGAGTVPGIIVEEYEASLVKSCDFILRSYLPNYRMTAYVNFIAIGRWK